MKNLSEFWKISIQLPGYYSWDEAQKACPRGWRLPTEAEWQELLDNTKYSFDDTLKQGVFKFEDGFELRLPAAGCRYNSSGSSSGQTFYGYYWSSTLEAGKSPRLFFFSSGANTNAELLAYGFSVRCVQESSEANCLSNSDISLFNSLKQAIQLGKVNPEILSMNDNELKRYIDLAKLIKNSLE